MLGRVKTETTWQWGAYGKLPFARDYFKVGAAFPLLNGFCEWIEKGYDTVARKNVPADRQHSWRFWMREGRSGHVVCGTVRDSADTLGRPYPFLIIGGGPLENWETNWSLLPYVFEKSWGLLEYLSTRMYADPRVLEEEVSSIRAPIPEWSRFRAERQTRSADSGDFVESAHRLLNRDGGGFLRIDGYGGGCFEAISLCHEAARRHENLPPNAVFTGGTQNMSYFAHFRRPLIISDFTRLWSAENGNIL